MSDFSPAPTGAPAIAAAPAVRSPSQEAAWEYAWTVREFTASDAMAATGMTRSTVIDALENLVGTGLLRELPNARDAGVYRKGRPARRFELRDDAALLVGVDAGRTHITVVVADLRSQPLATHRVVADGTSEDVAQRRRVLAGAVDEALVLAGRTRDEVGALCVGVPAPVDAAGRSPRHPEGFWDLMNPDLMSLFDWAVLRRVDNDASLAAVAEGAAGAAAGRRDYIALLAGDRLGAGVVLDGRLLRGAHGGVGEMIAFDHVEGVGSAHGLGQIAAQWAAEAVAAGEVDPASPLALAPEIDGRVVLELAAAGDPDARRITARVSRVLALIVSVLGSIFDPSLVVVSGAVAAGVDEVADAARRSLPTDLHLPAPELVVSTLGADVVVIGAVAAAADLARECLLERWSA
ncbi:ROK family protein [Microbacterium sp. F2E]|uniref:ROK family protein n=1 Tax=Microbacterium sp. F2E TaxID=2895284 RepID=UPI001E39C9FF|nr:ROK family protein [Microbacterium sp. F2E]MCC9053134.1 ROK family protein [Microbacterium sp. F2E]